MEKNDPSVIDWDDLKERIREAIRAVIQKDADELGISYGACVEHYFGPAIIGTEMTISRLQTPLNN